MTARNKTAILLVEDQAIIAMGEKIELEKNGYCVHIVSNGEKAVNTILENIFSIDLVLMDIDLGSGMDGIQTAEKILCHADLPILFLSSHTELEVVQKTERITSYGYVVKNSGIVVLDASIKMALKLYYEKSERRMLEIARDALLEKFRLLSDHIPGIIYQYQLLPDGTSFFPYSSTRMKEIYGVRPEDVEHDATPVFLALHPDDLEKVRASIQVSAQSLLPWHDNYRVILPSGDTIWVEGNSTPQKLDDGSILWHGYIHDIAERKKAEDELRIYREQLETMVMKRTMELEKEMLAKEKALDMVQESEAKYRNIVDYSTSIILEWDTEGNILYMNRYGLEYFGYEEKELIGRNVVGTIVEPVDTNGYNLKAKMDVVPKNPESYYSSENENIRKNGDKVWIAWTNKGIRNHEGNLIKTLSLGIDRTTQKQLENKLDYMKELDSVNNRLEREIAVRSKTEEKYRLALEATQDGLWDWDILTGEVYYSPAYFKMLGYENSNTALKVDFWLESIHPDDKEKALKKNTDCINGDCDNFSVEFRLRTAERNWLYILGRGKCISRNSSGRAIRMVGTHTDITMRKKSELMVAGLNSCFLDFGADAFRNINILVAFLGKQLDGTCALYNRLENGMLHSLGQWNAPVGYKALDYPEGHICNDVICSAKEEITLITDLQNTTYALTDPNVANYGLKTYLGKPVRCLENNVGSLCVVFQRVFHPHESELRLLELVASAIGVEESRRHTQELLDESEDKLRQLVESC
jgi:PAS domain S-box-containing protein